MEVSSDAFPTEIVWGERIAAWPADLGAAVKSEAGAHWTKAGETASSIFGGVGGLQKNTLHVGARLKEMQRLGANLATLDKLCRGIIAFASGA